VRLGRNRRPASGRTGAGSGFCRPGKGYDEPIIVEATGSFQADESSDVAPDTSGRVVATPVDTGDYVKQGAPLIRIQGVNADLRLKEAQAAATRAEANLKLAEARDQLAQTTAKRNAALLSNGLVPQTVADEAQTQAETTVAGVHVARASLAEAQAQLALAEKAVADVVVAAPFSGYISIRRCRSGNTSSHPRPSSRSYAWILCACS
jgi:multidrug resistance efflux pump